MIKGLEAELGAALFLRANKKISLTPEGLIFLNKSEHVLSEVYSLVDEMQDYGEKRRRTVKIGVPATVGTVLHPQLILDVQRNLNIELEVFEAPSDDTILLVEEETLDLAVVLLEEPLHYPGIDYRILHKSSMCFITNRDNPLAKKEVIDLAELENEKLIFFSPGVLAESLFHRRGIRPKYLLHSNQVLTIQKFIHAGLASTMQFPEPFTTDPRICALPLTDNTPLYFAVVRKKGKRGCDAVSQLYDFIRKENMPYL